MEWSQTSLDFTKTSRLLYCFPLQSEKLVSGSLVAVLITTLGGRKDSGATESFSEGHLWLTVPGRLCHPASIANEQTRGFSLKFIIVTMNEFKVPFSCRSQHIIFPSARRSPRRHKRTPYPSTC